MHILVCGVHLVQLQRAAGWTANAAESAVMHVAAGVAAFTLAHLILPACAAAVLVRVQLQLYDIQVGIFRVAFIVAGAACRARCSVVL
jgi:hypothetical protein